MQEQEPSIKVADIGIDRQRLVSDKKRIEGMSKTYEIRIREKKDEKDELQRYEADLNSQRDEMMI